MTSLLTASGRFDVVNLIRRRIEQRRTAQRVGILKPKAVRSRLVYERKDYKASPWWIYVLGGYYKNPVTREGKLFRARFRVPYAIVELATEWFPPSYDAIGREYCPITLKVLEVLRMLGRGAVVDDVVEGTGMNNETVRTFFHEL